jgi:hypothetical protein
MNFKVTLCTLNDLIQVIFHLKKEKCIFVIMYRNFYQDLFINLNVRYRIIAIMLFIFVGHRRIEILYNNIGL